MLILDALHVSPTSLAALKRHARQFIEQHVGSADLAAVLSPGAIEAASQDFTSDKARLLAAFDGFSGTKLRSATIELEEERQAAVDTGVVTHGGKDPSDAERAQSLCSVLEALAGVLGSSIAFVERGGRFESRVELAWFTVDSGGHGANGRSTRIDLRLTRDEFERAKATGIRWMSQLELAPGRYQLRVAARAPATGAAGLVTTDVSVPSFAGGPSMSGVLLTSLSSALMVTRGQSRLASAFGTVPTAERSFVAGDRIVAAVEAYVPATGAAAAGVKAEVMRIDGGAVLPLRDELAAGGRPGISEVRLAFDTSSSPPGRYILRIRLDGVQPAEPAERRVPFEVVAGSHE